MNQIFHVEFYVPVRWPEHFRHNSHHSMRLCDCRKMQLILLEQPPIETHHSNWRADEPNLACIVLCACAMARILFRHNSLSLWLCFTLCSVMHHPFLSCPQLTIIGHSHTGMTVCFPTLVYPSWKAQTKKLSVQPTDSCTYIVFCRQIRLFFGIFTFNLPSIHTRFPACIFSSLNLDGSYHIWSQTRVPTCRGYWSHKPCLVNRKLSPNRDLSHCRPAFLRTHRSITPGR
jgi:hypothetical protein